MNIERRVTAAFFLRLEKCVTVWRIIYDLILWIICGESYVELSGRYLKFVYKFDNSMECRACSIGKLKTDINQLRAYIDHLKLNFSWFKVTRKHIREIKDE